MTNETIMIDRPAKRWINALVTVILILAVMLCLYIVFRVMNYGYVSVGGYSAFRVVTGSMEPTISTGALLITKQMPMEDIQLRDIICFRTQNTVIYGRIVTHRVVDIFTGIDGSLLFETKGDANLAADGYLVTQNDFIGKVIWYTGENSVLSSIFSVFTSKVGFLACVIFPCLLLVALILRSSVKNIRNELREIEKELNDEAEKDSTLSGMTQEEYDEMYERLRGKLIEELKQSAENHKEE